MWYAGILAGGLSSRMGQDKSALELQGHSLLTIAHICLQQAGADRILVSGRPELSAGIADLHPHSGPPGALYSLVKHIHKQHGLDGSQLLLIPVDMPLLTAGTIRTLVNTGTNAACCHYTGEVFPCTFKLTQALLGYLDELFAEGNEPGGRRSMKSIMNHLGASQLPVQEISGQEFFNANTPAEWERIKSLIGAS